MTFDLTYLKNASPKDFESFFRLYYKPLCLTIARITSDKQAAEDVVQDAFIKLWTGRESLDIQVSLKSYLYRMAIHAAFDYLNKTKRLQPLDETFPHPTHHEVEETIMGTDTQARIAHAIEKLPPACKTIFVMHRYEDMTYKEIAETLHVSDKTVENQIGKALKILRELLKDLLLLGLPVYFLLNFFI